MSMSLHSLKQTDNIRSDPQLLIIYEVIVISFLHDFLVWLKYSAYCTRLKELTLDVRRPLSCGLSIVIVQQPAEPPSTPHLAPLADNLRLGDNQLIVEPLMVTLGMIRRQVLT
jgi:hypothetical protein